MTTPQLILRFAALPLCALAVAGCPGLGDLGDHDGGEDGVMNDEGGDNGQDAGDGGGAGDNGGDGGDGADGGDAGDGGGPPCSDAAGCPGPAPGAPNYLCADGMTTAGPACLEQNDGTCAWEFVECPPCEDADCGPAPGAPNFLCPDGVTVGGPGDCVDNGEGMCAWEFIECPPCCEPQDQPPCIEGATCCDDGTWACNNGQGQATCTAGPVCMNGGTCSNQGESCANGESCCGALMCCAGVPVPPGQEFCGDVCPISDRNKKEHFAAVDAKAILAKVVGLELSTWNYKAQPDAVRHLGPMAQDFKAAFGLGSTDKAIFTVDADGVALASIQALNAEVKALQQQNAELQATLAKLQAKLDKLERD